MTTFIRRLRALIALAGFCACAVAACGGTTVAPPPPPPGLDRAADVPTTSEPIGPVCESEADGGEEICATEGAVFPPNITAQKNAVWAYYTGLANGAGSPAMTMYQPDPMCSPQYQGNGLYAYRIPSVHSLSGPQICLWDSGSQVQLAPYDFWATYEIWQNHFGIQEPWYATLAINFLCQAAYERANFSYAAAYPYCSGDASSTVPAVRRWIHDVYYASQPFWQ